MEPGRWGSLAPGQTCILAWDSAYHNFLRPQAEQSSRLGAAARVRSLGPRALTPRLAEWDILFARPKGRLPSGV